MAYDDRSKLVRAKVYCSHRSNVDNTANCCHPSLALRKGSEAYMEINGSCSGGNIIISHSY